MHRFYKYKEYTEIPYIDYEIEGLRPLRLKTPLAAIREELYSSRKSQ